ncbi:translin associated factor x [Stemphylium lycopersici]|uniref:Translin associated factor x n=1 Tax=Stemphylium lycopersici TaxID=183478 RepID=A0A364NDS5_STELY|nr:translin associated factor x [Stemphylium lycopersici]RAR00555.1 translin associated factor x [Stemphylium lycopersici]RAR15426.1 translin associated factor x [Stemphylium lycopersici]
MADEKPEQSSSPFVGMFEGFRAELDEHHDRRERIIKASRDITASSKKMVRAVGQALPAWVTKKNAEYWEIIEDRYKNIASDLQGLNAYRYSHNITGGNQEFMEALSFQHYLETQSLITYDEAKSRIAAMSGEAGPITFTTEDYILGVCDMTGELMRFSVTSMATSGKLPSGKQAESNKRLKQDNDQEDTGDRMDIDEQTPVANESQKPRTVLDDLRAVRLQLEMFDAPGGSKFAAELETKKMPVMRECVDKVEKGLYGLTVRGNERPKGWMPDMSSARGAEIESY